MTCSDRQELTQACRPKPMKPSVSSDPTNHISARMQIMSFLARRARQQRGAVVGGWFEQHERYVACPLEQL